MYSALYKFWICCHGKAFPSINTVKELFKLEILCLADTDIIFVLVKDDVQYLDSEVNFISDLFMGFGLKFPQVREGIVDVQVTN